jgi:hypothetical protein
MAKLGFRSGRVRRLGGLIRAAFWQGLGFIHNQNIGAGRAFLR